MFGPEDAPEQVTGPAEDFCLVVTQRIHPDDTALQATPHARDWLLIAHAFADLTHHRPRPNNPNLDLEILPILGRVSRLWPYPPPQTPLLGLKT